MRYPVIRFGGGGGCADDNTFTTVEAFVYMKENSPVTFKDILYNPLVFGSAASRNWPTS